MRIVASGVRRSWETARSSAVLVASARSSTRGPALALAQAAVLQHQAGLHGERLEHPLVAGPEGPAAEPSTWSSSTGDPGVRRVRRARASVPVGRQHLPARRRSSASRETARSPNDSRSRSTIASAVSWPGEHRLGERRPAWRPRRGRGPPPSPAARPGRPPWRRRSRPAT